MRFKCTQAAKISLPSGLRMNKAWRGGPMSWKECTRSGPGRRYRGISELERIPHADLIHLCGQEALSTSLGLIVVGTGTNRIRGGPMKEDDAMTGIKFVI